MVADNIFTKIGTEFTDFFTQPNAYRSLLILIVSLILAYWLSHFVAVFIIRVAQIVARHTDNETDEERRLRLRQVETYLSVTVALVRAAVVAVVAYLVWKQISPKANSNIAAIGAGTVFIVVAGQTLGIILRDLTAGSTMIIEQWFNVGDYIKIEPFMEVAGVVERFTLRSTRLRTLSGEIVIIHNQQIAAVHVTPNAVRTVAVDVFVHDYEVGEREIARIINTVPIGPLMLAEPLKITSTERWDEGVWRITIQGQTPPGREWLIEKYFVNAIIEIDEEKPKSDRLIIHEPIARYTDPLADRRFKRAVRTVK